MGNNKFSIASVGNRRAFRDGARDGVPIALGYFAVSFSLGIVARNVGMTPIQGMITSALCNASAGEYAGFTMIAAGENMTRVKNSVATRARRKKVLKRAKGYFGSKHRLFKTAQEQVMHSERYAFRDRKQKKRDFRKLWITRINAGCRENGISYSRFIDGLNKAGVEVNRKMLSELAIYDKEAFANLVKVAKEGKVVVKPVKKETETKESKVVKKTDKKKKTKKEAPKTSDKKKTKTK